MAGALRETALPSTPERVPDQLFRLLVESVRDYAIFVLDPSGRVISWSLGAEHIKGYPASQILGQHFSRFYTIDDIRTGKPEFELRQAREHGRFEDYGLRVRADGSCFWAHVVITALYDEQRRLVGFAKITQDITEQRRSEQELLRQTAQVSEQALLLDLAPAAICVRGADDEITYWNAGAEALYGWCKDEALGKRSHELLRTEFAQPLSEISAQLAATGFWAGELTHVSKDGSKLLVASRWALQREADNGLESVIEINTDITQQRSLEEQLRHSQKMDAVGRLAAGVAHDFNNLLTIISAQTTMLLLAPELDKATREEVAEIDRAAERAAALAQQLLAFSRRQPPALTTIEVNQIVGRMQKMVRRIIGEPIDVATICAPHLPPIWADAAQLEQAILNLVINARDAMPDGGTLTLRTRLATAADPQRGNAAGRDVVIEVSDTGKGIDREMQSRIFEPFFTTKEAGKGTGLGLAIVHGIVTASGGQIQVHSEPRRGTTFRMIFPAATEAAERALPAETRAAATPATILIVEDEQPVLRLVKRILESRGYKTLAASSASQAMELCRKQPPDLLLTDVIMPNTSGVALAQNLRSEFPSLRLMFMSGYPEEVSLGEEVLEHAFLQKPFTPEELVSRVQAVLERERALPIK